MYVDKNVILILSFSAKAIPEIYFQEYCNTGAGSEIDSQID